MVESERANTQNLVHKIIKILSHQLRILFVKQYDFAIHSFSKLKLLISRNRSFTILINQKNDQSHSI